MKELLSAELKNYIERYGKLKDTQVIPLSISNTEELRKSFKKLMRTGTIQCVVGTFNPNLFSIPFLSVAEVFGTPKQHIPNLLNMEKEAKSALLPHPPPFKDTSPCGRSGRTIQALD